MSLAPLRRALASALRLPLASRYGARALSMEGIESFKKAERAAEALYFNKKEEILLRNLLVKIQAQADTLAAQGVLAAENAPLADVSDALAAERKALHDIIGKYKVSEADATALLLWKHTPF
ncbi:hypothetical protein T484DRAFT_1759990 [Baffinella frigidus]|nr:hypothetical protein T484DRAFT_1759990 [Cryptophyta sp. CCMP2293]